MRRLAAARGVSGAQMALAALCALIQAATITPLVGSTRPQTVQGSIGAAQLYLDDGEVASLR